ncbi:M15 family metallopeptidase [Anaerosphaera multitolerans]|uniref:M15 family peptidase n=1 Tax=Anaerosphaera multitolerans TaxID=2487351 RepID=A0A437S705_9FIRM|nr:M15 family metallopeptidase [Anaerosphaera multitolerans]RVU54813.1 M15 family peptidase [Anaerosphaera multitolerans]
MKKFIIAILLLISIFFIFPKTGLYGLLFDWDRYEPVDENSTETISDLNQLSPKTKKLAEKFLEKCAENNLAVEITETYRTQARQNMLYEQGRSTPGPIVTWTKTSKHTKRRAFDIVKANTSNPYGDEEFFKKCADIGEEIGLTSGYYFERYQDMPHFEYNPWWN